MLWNYLGMEERNAWLRLAYILVQGIILNLIFKKKFI